LLAGALERATFDRDLLLARAGSKFLTATELADTLVRLEGLSFREAHHIVSESVKTDPTDDSHARIVDDVIAIAARAFSRDLSARRAELLTALDPVHFVECRAIPGGPARHETERQIETENALLETSREWRARCESRLEHARAELSRAVRLVLT
jgi:argininosuccinate lyase